MLHRGGFGIQHQRLAKAVVSQRKLVQAQVNQAAQVVGFKQARVYRNRLLELVERNSGLTFAEIVDRQLQANAGAFARLGLVRSGNQVGLIGALARAAAGHKPEHRSRQ